MSACHTYMLILSPHNQMRTQPMLLYYKMLCCITEFTVTFLLRFVLDQRRQKCVKNFNCIFGIKTDRSGTTGKARGKVCLGGRTRSPTSSFPHSHPASASFNLSYFAALNGCLLPIILWLSGLFCLQGCTESVPVFSPFSLSCELYLLSFVSIS